MAYPRVGWNASFLLPRMLPALGTAGPEEDEEDEEEEFGRDPVLELTPLSPEEDEEEALELFLLLFFIVLGAIGLVLVVELGRITVRAAMTNNQRSNQRRKPLRKKKDKTK